MSRIRTIKPEFWKDERVGELSPRARLLFIALWNFSDDMGTARGTVPYLRSEVFPYDDISMDAMAGILAELVSRNLVRPFQHEGQTYLSVHHFQRHQNINRPSGAKYPNPPTELWNEKPQAKQGRRRTHGKLSEDSVSPHGTLTGGASHPIPSLPISESESARAREVELTQSDGKADAPVIPFNARGSRS